MSTSSVPRSLPRARSSERGHGVAPLVDGSSATLQRGLFLAGALMLPLGLVVICLGWYGVAHTPYTYDQLAYLVSGGILGLGITFVGGFLYFGSWLARIAADQRAAQAHLGDTLLVLADAVSHAAGASVDAGAVAVVAGDGRTVHRADCELLVGRTDVRPAGPAQAGMVPCRLCSPSARTAG